LAQFPDEENAIRRVFQALTDPGTGDRPIRRKQSASQLSAVSAISAGRLETILDAFMARDFLREEKTSSDQVVDLMHESVMWQWPRLRDWIIDESAEASRLRFFREAAQKKLALTGATLEEAQSIRVKIKSSPKWVRRYLSDEGEIQRILDWILESERRQRSEIEALRRGRTRLLWALGAAVLAAVLIAWFWWQGYVSRRETREQLAQNYWQTSRTAQAAGDNLGAQYFAAEAIRLLPSLQRTVLLDLRAISLPWISATFSHQDTVRGALFNHDESRILTWSSDRTARLWDARTGQHIGAAMQHQGVVEGAQFNHDESRILTWSFDHTARLWDARTGQQIGPALQHPGMVVGAQFNHDESLILTWSFDHTARLWDARTGQQIGPALQHQDTVEGAQFNHDESRILTWSEDHTARVWLLNADLDFPADQFILWIQAATDTDYDVLSREVKTLDPARWREIRNHYEQVAAEHAKTCKYPEANQWLQLHNPPQ
jgi:conflict system STAND superfamily ATPase/WD40 domain-containing protein